MNRRHAWAAIAAAGLAVLTGCGDGQVQRASPSLSVSDVTIASQILEPAERDVAPDLSGETLDGEPFDAASWRGQVVVVNYWGSWCAPCRAETPELVELAEQTEAAGVRFLGINIRDDRTAARAFVDEFGVPYPSLFDPSATTAFEFGPMAPRAVPATYLLDHDGRVAAFAFGRVTGRDLHAMINAVLDTPTGDQT